MSTLQLTLLMTWIAGLAMPIGALLASAEHIQTQWLENDLRHFVLAFGAGALLSAVALVLVPEGVEHLGVISASGAFIGGAIAFLLLDRFMDAHDTPAGQLAAMLSDFLPEAAALGAAAATGTSSTILLAVLMAAQNLPEGFNAFRELRDRSPLSARTICGAFLLLSLLGPVAGYGGLQILSGTPKILAIIKLAAAGGILYTIMQDMAPQVPAENSRIPPLGAVFGFVLGMVGYMLV